MSTDSPATNAYKVRIRRRTVINAPWPSSRTESVRTSAEKSDRRSWIPGTRPRRDERVDVGELGVGQDLRGVRRHLVSRRADETRELRERDRIRPEARPGRGSLRLAAVALIAADFHVSLPAAIDRVICKRHNARR